MGTGKTTIGRKLAVRLGYRFIDTDQFIEWEQNCRVQEIFATRGEACFRKLETSLLKRLINVDNTVVATGGGIMVTPENRELIRKIGKTVHLKSSLEDIYERVTRNTKRPLVQTDDPLKAVTELYEKRKHLYTDADVTVDTQSLKMWMVVSKIICDLCELDEPC